MTTCTSPLRWIVWCNVSKSYWPNLLRMASRLSKHRSSRADSQCSERSRMTATQLPAQQVFSVQWSGDIRWSPCNSSIKRCCRCNSKCCRCPRSRKRSRRSLRFAFEVHRPSVSRQLTVWFWEFRKHSQGSSVSESREIALQACDYLATSRPTAVNLFWALDRMRAIVQAKHKSCGACRPSASIAPRSSIDPR